MFLDPGESEVHVRWVREFASALSPFSSGPYLNHVGAEGEESAAELRAACGINFERLAALKQRYDPANLFGHGHNVLPGAQAPAGRLP